jgi:hypothetical protein
MEPLLGRLVSFCLADYIFTEPLWAVSNWRFFSSSVTSERQILKKKKRKRKKKNQQGSNPSLLGVFRSPFSSLKS